MKNEEIFSPFQFIGHRVTKLTVETKPFRGGSKVTENYNYDYKVSPIEEQNAALLAVLSFTVDVRIKSQNKTIVRVLLDMEGAFQAKVDAFSHAKFAEMTELNGLITLMHIARSLIVSVTAQSGIQPPVRLPMININKLRESKKQALHEKPNSD